MVLLRGLNYDYSGQQDTVLKESVAAGKISISVENSEGFADDDYLIIEPGTEEAEVVQIDGAPSSGEMTISATKFTHAAGVKIFRTDFDQMRFYESTTTSDTGTWNVVDTVDMDFSKTHTNHPYPVPTASGMYYRRTFYNSTTSVESSIYLSKSWQTDDEELYVTPEEMRIYLQFDTNDFPSPADLRFFIKIAQINVSLDMDTSVKNLLFIATLLQSKVEVMRALASKALAKGYIQVNAEGRTITKAYQELRLEAENAIQEYKGFIMRNNRREATSTQYLADTSLIDDYTRIDIINMMNGVTDGQDFQQKYGFRRL